MNCKQAKAKLALLIGNDLDAVAAAEVQKHLSQCVGCRQHLQHLSSCLEALQVSATGSVEPEVESLWPQISVRLASLSGGEKPHRLSGWAPTLAVAAACTAMFWVARYQFVDSGAGANYSSPTGPVPLQPVDEPLNPVIQPYRPQARVVQPTKGGEPRQREAQSGTMPWID
jgi:predicted anti-sigma-YlaC factor YlaD